jgi:glycosyltransferase involved in cell wall biosynthesis
MSRSLYSEDKRSPYYIWAPDYTEISSGIRALHILCHALNVKGCEAYITSSIVNDKLRTPILTESIKLRHRETGKEPIVVYPEIVSGNPLNARKVVRYVLYKPGVYGGDTQYNPNEFILEFRSDFLPEGLLAEAKLYLPASDIGTYNMDGVDESKRSGSCCYLGRYTGDTSAAPVDAVEISYRNPRTEKELAALYKQSEFLYTFVDTAATLEARLCGCTVVYLPNEQLTEWPSVDEIGRAGCAWGDSPEEIGKAKAGVSVVHDHYARLIKDFQADLDLFIQLSQNYVQDERNCLIENNDSLTDKYLAKLLDIENSIGEPLYKISCYLMENKKYRFFSRRDQDTSFLNIARYLISRANGSDEGEERATCIQQASLFIKNVLAGGEMRAEASELQECWAVEKRNWLYEEWGVSHLIKPIDAELYGERLLTQWKQKPIFHFLLFLLPNEAALLGDSLDSLAEQLYTDWRLTVISDTGAPDPLWDTLPNLQWLHCGVDDNPYELLNKAIVEGSADWVSFIRPGVTWPMHALLELISHINMHAEVKTIYTDFDYGDDQDVKGNPHFLPDINLEWLRTTEYPGKSIYFLREAFLAVGGFEALPEAENYDALFKMLEAWGETSISHVAEVLLHYPLSSKRSLNEDVQAFVVKNHLERSGVAALVGKGYLENTLRLTYVHTDNASVSIIIPNKNKSEYINTAVTSILNKTDYDRFEIIVVDQGSSDEDTLAFYKKLTSEQPSSVRVLYLDENITYAEACNFGADIADGEYILFTESIVEARQPQWLTRVMQHVQRPEVGIAGGRIVSAETTYVTHAGILLGYDGLACSPYSQEITMLGKGYLGRAQTDQNVSAISKAFLAINKDLFLSVGGMDAQNLHSEYIDVDLCLRVTGLGEKIVWTPYATLTGYYGNAKIFGESQLEEALRCEKQRKRDRTYMLDTWLPQLSHDPAYNPNLGLDKGSAFFVDNLLPRNWNPHYHDRLHVLGFSLASGSGEYRLRSPFKALSDAALMQTESLDFTGDRLAKLSMPTLYRLAPDVLLVQATFYDAQLQLLEDIKRYMPEVFVIYSSDDFEAEIPEKSSVFKQHKKLFRDKRARLRKALSLCDRLIVSTRPLADAYGSMIDDIKLIPNRLEKSRWLHLNAKRGFGDKPRVGWVGAHQHRGDLEIIIDVVKQTKEQIDWVFMGMCPEEIRSDVKEFHSEWVAFEDYPSKVASLNLDIAVAPLEVNRFNEGKSNLRLLEYGVLGWPVICTDITPYQAYNAPVRRVANETQQWVDAILDYAIHPEKATQDGITLQKWVKRNFLLEDHLDEWQSALTPPAMQQPKSFLRVS